MKTIKNKTCQFSRQCLPENFIVLNMFPNRGKEYNKGRMTVCISVQSIAYFFETEFSCEFENEKPFTYKRTIIKLIEGSMLDIEETIEGKFYQD